MLNHLWGLVCSSCPTWEPPFVFAMLGEQLLAPCMPNEFYSCLEGQDRDRPFHKAQGPLRWGAVGERVLGVPALPPATPPSTAPEVQAPPLL